MVYYDALRMNSETSTYTTTLILEHDTTLMTAGFCLSKKIFEALKAERVNFLHSKENVYFNKLLYPKRQYSYLAGRYCAKKAISILSSENDPTLLHIQNGIFQQPIVYHPSHHNVQVSISHTNNFGTALAFSETHPMAIDIETICSNKIATVQTQLTEAEQILGRKIVASKSAQFILLWTIKEALSKILKCGFTVPFEILEIANLAPQAHFIMSHFKNFPQYQAFSFLLGDIACSLVYPKNTCLKLDTATIQQRFGKEYDT